jgi:hypothetical protein
MDSAPCTLALIKFPKVVGGLRLQRLSLTSWDLRCLKNLNLRTFLSFEKVYQFFKLLFPF